MQKINLAGRRFGRLLVIEEVPCTGKDTRWLCLCDCSTKKEVLGSSLRSGNTKSCGCFRREQGVVAGRQTVRHGGWVGNQPSVEWYTWSSMKQRCLRSSHPQYHRYGGRGITVCQRWMEFENFFADMGTRPTPDHSIDRIDNDGPYSPENCRWATKTEQNRNTSRNVHVAFRGEVHTAAEWCQIVGLPRPEYDTRIRRGETPQQALSAPPSAIPRVVRTAVINGKTATIAEWCRELGISYRTVANRIRRGVSVEVALTTPPHKLLR